MNMAINIAEQMTPDEYKWHVNLVQERYEYLTLSYQQAESIYEFENARSVYSDKHYLSDWEELDYQVTTFREILDKEQFQRFEVLHNASVVQYQQTLLDNDKEENVDTEYMSELLRYYEEQFVPPFFNDLYIQHLLPSAHTKIQYLKKEYQIFLIDSKKQLLISHFRHYRSFKPNHLKRELLRLKLMYILPDFDGFYRQSDEPTKTVIQFLKARLTRMPHDTVAFIKTRFDELNAFTEATLNKFYPDRGGWHTIGAPSSDEEKWENHTMTVVLLDKQKYGFK